MSRPALVRTAPLLVCAVLAACSSSTTTGPHGASAPPAAAPPSASTAPTAPTAPVTSAASEPGSAAGTIGFTGAISGTMSMFACHQGGPAQLVVKIDGEQTTYNGVIDAEDFSFLGPGKSGWTLADGAPRPTVSGTTYSVKKTKLVGVFDDRTITADGSVTCPTG